MNLIADILLAAGAFGAAFYCWVLSRRLSRLNSLEGGVGGAVASLTRQVDEMTQALDSANAAAGASTESLQKLTKRAEGVARRLELLVASMHDLPPDERPSPDLQPDETSASTLFLSQRSRIHEAAE